MRILPALILAAGALAAAPPLQAQVAPPGELQLVDDLSSLASVWEANMRPALVRLFLILATLDLAWTALGLCLRQGVLEAWAGRLAEKLLFYGFGLALLRFGPDWAEAVIRSLVALAGLAQGGAEMSHRTLMELCFETVAGMHEGMGFFEGIGLSLFIGLAILAILAVFAYISFVLILAWAEACLVLGAGTVVLGLGGSEWTRSYAHRYLHYAFLAGLRLFITLLIGRLGIVLIGDWVADLQADDIVSISHGLISLLLFALLIGSLPGRFVAALGGGGGPPGGGLVTRSFSLAGSALSGGAPRLPAAVVREGAPGSGIRR